jgi:hypothetical protein
VLHIKMTPGLRIQIGKDVHIDVVLDSRRKLALKVSAPRALPIEWATPQAPKLDRDPDNHNT